MFYALVSFILILDLTKILRLCLRLRSWVNRAPDDEVKIRIRLVCSKHMHSLYQMKAKSNSKEMQEKYRSTTYSRSGVNQMWILKNAKELLNRQFKVSSFFFYNQQHQDVLILHFIQQFLTVI
jgi:hypothetical protein